MSIRKVLVGATFGALGLLFSSCAGLPGTLCDLECECEHCNDWEYDATCDRRTWEQDVADAYDCVDRWETWAECVENNGHCDEEQARWSTRAPGSCTGTMTMGACTDNAQCDMGSVTGTCVGGQCEYRACAPENQIPCGSDGDCSGGSDLCQAQSQALDECIEAASSVSLIYTGGNTSQPPEPAPGN